LIEAYEAAGFAAESTSRGDFASYFGTRGDTILSAALSGDSPSTVQISISFPAG